LNFVGKNHDILVPSFRNDSKPTQAANRYELERWANEIFQYVDNKQLNSFPADTNLGLNGNKLVNIAAGSDPSDGVNR
jgi:hypothetical protein